MIGLHGLTFTGMAPDYLPRISSVNCGYPFTYLGGLYHRCVENLENVTASCERWGCFAVNYTGAVCAADIGKTPCNEVFNYNSLGECKLPSRLTITLAV